MLIGGLAKKTGCSRDTLRFYEKLGLIQGEAKAGSGNNYKHYSEEMAERVALIKKAKLLGFTLTEIKRLVDDWESNRLSIPEKIGIFEDKLAHVEDKIRDLHEVKAYLACKLDLLRSGVNL